MSTDSLTIAEHEARAYAAWLSAHGYDEASVWRYAVALDNHGCSRQSFAAGFAVRYAGTLVRDDGSVGHPTTGITVFCQDSAFPAKSLITAGRALITTGDGSERQADSRRYTPHYAASWNLRDTAASMNRDLHGGTTLPYVILHELTPGIGTDGPMRFYDLRLVPAGDLATGDRVRVVSGTHGGLRGVVTHPDAQQPMVELDPVYAPAADTTRPWGSLHQISRADLEPGDTCADGHALRWDAESYATPRWVHASGADLMTCTTVMADPGSVARTMPWLIEGWEVRRMAGSRQGRWIARLFDEKFDRRTLAEVRDEIAARKEMDRPL